VRLCVPSDYLAQPLSGHGSYHRCILCLS
jgi:hypothetical protein